MKREDDQPRPLSSIDEYYQRRMQEAMLKMIEQPEPQLDPESFKIKMDTELKMQQQKIDLAKLERQWAVEDNRERLLILKKRALLLLKELSQILDEL